MGYKIKDLQEKHLLENKCFCVRKVFDLKFILNFRIYLIFLFLNEDYLDIIKIISNFYFLKLLYMWVDMWRWGWYDYQWLLSFYLFTLMKNEEYFLDKNKKYSWKDFSLFVNRMNKFKKKCIDKYWDDFTLKVEILVEWEERCLEDITFISNDEWNDFDNNIFIQVKTKWWEDNNTISTSDWIYKAITNFVFNTNFQKDKGKWNILFFIFTNKPLTSVLTRKVQSWWPELYLDFINHIIWLKKTDLYPNNPLKNLYKKENNDLIIDLLNSKDIIIQKYLNIYSKEDLFKLLNLVNDLKLIFNNLDIITKIDYDILEFELEAFYWETIFLRELRRINKLCFKWVEINRWTVEFERYENYPNTYFIFDGKWKFIKDIDCITRWKFI